MGGEGGRNYRLAQGWASLWLIPEMLHRAALQALWSGAADAISEGASASKESKVYWNSRAWCSQWATGATTGKPRVQAAHSASIQLSTSCIKSLWCAASLGNGFTDRNIYGAGFLVKALRGRICRRHRIGIPGPPVCTESGPLVSYTPF